MRPVPDWLIERNYAHRGFHSDGIPENSRAAIRAAIGAGMGIECDIQMSRDMVPMVFHDWDLDRLTIEHGPVARHSARELERLTLSGTDERILRLDDMLEDVAGRAPILLEVKARPDLDLTAACIAITRNIADYAGPLAVMSFDARVGEWFEGNDPARLRGLVTTDTLDHGYKGAWRRAHAIERAAPDFLACDIRDLPNAIASLWREAGRPLLSWTVRTADLRVRAERLADATIAEGEGVA